MGRFEGEGYLAFEKHMLYNICSADQSPSIIIWEDIYAADTLASIRNADFSRAAFHGVVVGLVALLW